MSTVQFAWTEPAKLFHFSKWQFCVTGISNKSITAAQLQITARFKLQYIFELF